MMLHRMILKGEVVEPQDALGPTSRSVGYAFVDEDRCLHDADIGLHLLSSMPHLEKTVADLNGCFAALLSTDEGLMAITDRSGSIPVYAARNSQGVMLSEDPWEIVRRLDSPPELDELAAFDLVRLGYVAGARTLIRGVQVLPPGSITTIADGSVRSARYWRYGYRVKQMSDEFARQELARVLSNMASRFTACLERMGKHATVALSGGWDSRVISSVLLDAGCDVKAISYGGPHSAEVAKAKEVASTLGIDHSFAPIDSSYLNDDFIEESVREVGITTRFTCGAAARNLPPLQNAVVMPGHIGTLGGELSLATGLVRTKKQLRDYLYFRHYHYPYADQVLSEIVTIDHQKLRWLHLDEILEDFDPNVYIQGEIQRWNLENRQRKLNWMEMRAYERRFDWMLPLFDYEFVDFMAKVPDRMRAGRDLFVRTPLEFMFKDKWPNLLSIGRVGGRPFEKGPSRYRQMRIMRGLQPLSGWIFAPLLPRLRNVNAARHPLPPKSDVADPLWFWFITDATVRDFLISKVETIAPSIVDASSLKQAMLGTRVTEDLFHRVVAGTITLDEVARLAGRLWTEKRSVTDQRP